MQLARRAARSMRTRGPVGVRGNIQAIVERTTGSRLRMPRLLIGWLLQTRTHGRQVQQVIVLPAHNNAGSASGEEIGKRSGIAIQSVQTSQDVGEGKRKRAGIAADHRSGSQQFTPVITIAGVAERAQPLVRMRLQNRRSRACDFSPFASQVAGRRDQLKAAMGRRKVCGLGKCSLPDCLFGAIDIHHGPMASQAIPHPTRWRSERRSRHQIAPRKSVRSASTAA